MAKPRNRRHDSRRWKPSDSADLLALADVFQELSQEPTGRREKDLVTFLESKLQDRGITAAQIKAKLHHECFRQKDGTAAEVFEKFLQHGTSALRRLDPDFRAEVAERTRALEIDHYYQSPRKLRSGTQFQGERSEREMDGVRSTISQLSSRKGTITARTQSLRSSVIRLKPVEDSKSPTPTPRSSNEQEDEADIYDYTFSSPPPDPASENNRGIWRNHKAQVNDFNGYDNDLREQTRDFKHGYNESELGPSETHSKVIEALSEQVRRYKARDRIQNEFGTYHVGEIYDSRDQTLSGIRDCFKKMRQKCLVVADGDHFIYTKIQSIKGISGHLFELILIASNQDRAPSELRSVFNRLQAQMTGAQLTLCLIGAAIKHWTLMPPFMFRDMQETELLIHYRAHIFALGSPEVLQAVDFRAHRDLIEKESFQTIFLYDQAKIIANRFIQALKSFISTPMASTEQEALEENLIVIFQSALQIKCLSLSCKYHYDPIWPTPSSVVSSELVSYEQQASFTDRENSNSRVRFPLIPGICRYRRESQFVDYCNFDSKEGKILDSLEVVCKATVVGSQLELDGH